MNEDFYAKQSERAGGTQALIAAGSAEAKALNLLLSWAPGNG
jgi:hypothetical protein